MTETELKEIEARANAVTTTIELPKEEQASNSFNWIIPAHELQRYWNQMHGYQDARLELCRTDIPALIAAIRERDARIEKLEDKVKLIGQDFTCLNCANEPGCEYAWDSYNTNGDCLAEK